MSSRSPLPPDPVYIQIRGSLQSPGSSLYPDQMVDRHLERSSSLKDSGTTRAPDTDPL